MQIKKILQILIFLMLTGCDQLNLTSLLKADPVEQGAEIVKLQLKSPSSFKKIGGEIIWEGKTNDGLPAYIVSVLFDASNSFGASLRGCMFVAYSEDSSKKIVWDKNYGVNDYSSMMNICNPTTPASIKKDLAKTLAEINFKKKIEVATEGSTQIKEPTKEPKSQEIIVATPNNASQPITIGGIEFSKYSNENLEILYPKEFSLKEITNPGNEKSGIQAISQNNKVQFEVYSDFNVARPSQEKEIAREVKPSSQDGIKGKLIFITIQAIDKSYLKSYQLFDAENGSKINAIGIKYSSQDEYNSNKEAYLQFKKSWKRISK